MKGAYVSFNGDQDSEQVGCLANGVKFNSGALHAFMNYKWVWKVEIVFVYHNGKLPERHVPFEFETSEPIKLDDLTELVLECQTQGALECPEGYKYKTKTWTAKIIRGVC